MSGHRLRGRIARLQERWRAAPGLRVCPHQSWRIAYEPPEQTPAEPLAVSEAAPLPPCWCGRPRGEIVVQMVADAEPGE